MEEKDQGYSGENMITKNRTLAWLLVKLRIPVIYEKAGIRFYCPDPLSMWRADTLFEKEPETLTWIAEGNGKFLDIGASTGIYSLYAATYRIYRMIVACEIDPKVQAILGRNIRENCFEGRIISTGTIPSGEFDHIKIDTDGDEVRILKDNPALIKGAKSIMIEESPGAAGEIQKILVEYGFTCRGRYISPMMERSEWKDYRNAVWKK